MKGKESLAYSKPCSKVVHLQQTIHFGYKTFGWTYAQTEIERNILKWQIKYFPTIFNWTAIVTVSLNFEVGSKTVRKGLVGFQEAYFLL